MPKPKLAAQRLFEAHQRREAFAPLVPELAPRTTEEAYAIQDSFVAGAVFVGGSATFSRRTM